jgi:hypothetical protein
MMTLVFLFIVGLMIGFAILTYWKQALVVIAALCFALVFAGVLRMIAAVNALRGQG